MGGGTAILMTTEAQRLVYAVKLLLRGSNLRSRR